MATSPEVILKHNTDVKYFGWNPESRSGVNTKLENQGKASYIDWPYSSAARYNWPVDDGFAVRDDVCEAWKRLKVTGVGKRMQEFNI